MKYKSDVGLLDVGLLDVGLLDVGLLDVGLLDVGLLDVGLLEIRSLSQLDKCLIFIFLPSSPMSNSPMSKTLPIYLTTTTSPGLIPARKDLIKVPSVL